jgi:HEAT repeat protein
LVSRRLSLAVLFATACAASPAERAIDRGNLTALRDVIGASERAGRLSNGDAAQLAKATADRELRTAFGAGAVDRVRDARPCARELDGALSERMRTHDAAGAQAALARIDGGGLSMSDARAFAKDPDPDWQAVGARSLGRREDHDARMRALVAPQPQVRREAARAARDAKDPDDMEALLEAARLDPEPIVRTTAVRAIAALPATPNTGHVVDALRDLWQSGDDGLREDIALAWAGPVLWSGGGRDALRTVIAAEHGPAAIEGAAAVLRHRAADVEIAQDQEAVGHLARAIESGSPASRLQALAQAPLDREELLAVVRKTTEDGDLHVRVAALARLAEKGDARAVESLEALAAPGSPVGERARFALAVSRDRRVQAWIEQDLGADRVEQRLAAATTLAVMGVAARGAPLLADADAGVRVRAACTMMMAVRGR